MMSASGKLPHGGAWPSTIVTQGVAGGAAALCRHATWVHKTDLGLLQPAAGRVLSLSFQPFRLLSDKRNISWNISSLAAALTVSSTRELDKSYQCLAP